MDIYNDDMVRGDLFKESGKWAYTVALEYDGTSYEDYEDWDLWKQARNALARATANGVSGVRLSEIPHGWTLVVLEPYAKNGYPIIVEAGS